MRQTDLVLFWRRGVPVDLKTRNFVVLVVKSEENAETAFGFNLHAQNITIKCLDGFQVVHFQDHMSYSFNWHHHFHKYGYEAVLRAEVAKDSGSLRAGVIVVIFDPQLTKYADQTFQNLKSSRVLNCSAMQIGDVFGSNHVGFLGFVSRPVFTVIVEVDGWRRFPACPARVLSPSFLKIVAKEIILRSMFLASWRKGSRGLLTDDIGCDVM